MESILKGLIAKKIDVNCGSNVAYRGEVISVTEGILKIVNEDGHDIFIAIDKVAAITETKDFGSRPGFIV